MGYKLAGFHVLGGVEIDPEMMSLYRSNHKPKHSYLMGVQDFNKLSLDEIPDELKDLDILDGSPPCSVFSMAGKREKKWGKEFHFREGQQKQKLDDLFGHFIEVGKRLQPKIIVAENVKGLLSHDKGKTFGTIIDCLAKTTNYQMSLMPFDNLGYHIHYKVLNTKDFGIPQNRERIFIIGIRDDEDNNFYFPKEVPLELKLKDILQDNPNYIIHNLSKVSYL